jgi:hypothetical protein
MVTLAQTELTRELHWNVCIITCGLVPTDTQKAVTLVAKIEVALYLHRISVDWLLCFAGVKAVVTLRAFIATIASTTATTIATSAIFPISTLLVLILILILVALTLVLVALTLVLLTLTTFSALATFSAIFAIATLTIATISTVLLTATGSLQFAHATFVLRQFNFPLGKWFAVGTDIHNGF